MWSRKRRNQERTRTKESGEKTQKSPPSQPEGGAPRQEQKQKQIPPAKNAVRNDTSWASAEG